MSFGGRGGGWVVGQFLLMAAILVLGAVPPTWPGWVRLAGVPVLLGGLAFAIWAGRTLGSALTPYPLPSEQGTLVERGPYGLVRHPIYAAGLLVFLGYGLLASVPATAGWRCSRSSGTSRRASRSATSRSASPATPTTGGEYPEGSELGRARVELAGERRHERVPLRDDGAVAVLTHDRFDPLVLVPVDEEEGRPVLADSLVLLERRLDAVRARRVGAFAHELRLAGVEPLGGLGDALVHLAEQRLGPRDLLSFAAVHRLLPFSADAVEEDNVEPPASGARDRYAFVVRQSWPEPVERVAAYLRAAGAEARLEELEAGTATAEDAARAAGCPIGQIVKSIVVLCDGRPVVVLVPGDRRVDLAKITRASGAAEARIARGAEVEEATGFAPGSVAPFPLPNVDRVLIDQNLLAHETVWVGAGSAMHMAAMNPGVLVRLARAQPMDAVQD